MPVMIGCILIQPIYALYRLKILFRLCQNLSLWSLRSACVYPWTVIRCWVNYNLFLTPKGLLNISTSGQCICQPLFPINHQSLLQLIFRLELLNFCLFVRWIIISILTPITVSHGILFRKAEHPLLMLKLLLSNVILTAILNFEIVNDVVGF